MYRRKQDMETSARENARGGEGTIYFTEILKAEELAGQGRLFSRITLPVGTSMGMHTHEGEYEIYFILSGSALVSDGEQDVLLSEGEVSVCNDGEQHALSNAGAVPLELLATIVYTK